MDVTMAKAMKLQAGRSPSPAEVLAARTAAGLTQTKAAEKVYAQLRTWQGWEGDKDREMPPALFELFLIKTGQIERLAAWVADVRID